MSDPIGDRFGPAWANKLQGRIRALMAKAEHSSAGPALTRREINAAIVEAFEERLRERAKADDLPTVQPTRLDLGL